MRRIPLESGMTKEERNPASRDRWSFFRALLS
jgi:hypothetical protein